VLSVELVCAALFLESTVSGLKLGDWGFPADIDWGLRLTYTGPIPAAERRIPDEY